jgi:hypothetical protein
LRRSLFKEGVEEQSAAVPRQLQDRQLIVTLALATPEVWASLAKELSGEYGLDRSTRFFRVSERSLEIRTLLFITDRASSAPTELTHE